MDRNTTLHINDTILYNAFQYAESKGLDLSSVVESFLVRMMTAGNNNKIKNFPISDKVKSLAGRLKTDYPINWEKEIEEALKEKYCI